MKQLLLTLGLLSAVFAKAQYVQFGANLLSLPVGIASADLELPLAPRVALQLEGGAVVFSGDDSLWAEDDITGRRFGAVGKVYLFDEGRLHEGLFVGGYMRSVRLDVRHESSGLLFSRASAAYRSQKTVAGILGGYTLVDGGFSVTVAGGFGSHLSREYTCLRGDVASRSGGCRPRHLPTRDGDVHVYGRVSVGYRLYAGSAKLRKEEAELEARARFERRRRERVSGERAYYDEVLRDGRPAGMSDVKWRRLQRKLRYRTQQRY